MSYTKIQWGILTFFLFLDIVWIKISSFSITYNGKVIFYLALILSFLCILNIFYRKFRPDPIITPLLQLALLFFIYCPLMLIFCYLVATTNQPFMDSSFASIDSFFGIYSPSIVSWFGAHEFWHAIFSFIYNTYQFQFPALLFYFIFCGKPMLFQRFLTQFMIAAPLTIVIFGFLPAGGPYFFFGYTPSIFLMHALDHLLQLRQNIFDITSLDGIVMLPSFHTVMALLFTYALRNERKIIFIPFLILNAFMIFSCLPIGEHYFVDILAAVPVFFISVWIEQLIFRAASDSKLLQASQK